MTISIRSLLRVILTCGDKSAAWVSVKPSLNLKDNVTFWLLNITSNLKTNSSSSINFHSKSQRQKRKQRIILLSIDAYFRLSSCSILYHQKELCYYFDDMCRLKDKIALLSPHFRLKIQFFSYSSNHLNSTEINWCSTHVS